MGQKHASYSRRSSVYRISPTANSVRPTYSVATCIPKPLDLPSCISLSFDSICRQDSDHSEIVRSLAPAWSGSAASATKAHWLCDAANNLIALSCCLDYPLIHARSRSRRSTGARLSPQLLHRVSSNPASARLERQAWWQIDKLMG